MYSVLGSRHQLRPGVGIELVDMVFGARHGTYRGTSLMSNYLPPLRTTVGPYAHATAGS